MLRKMCRDERKMPNVVAKQVLEKENWGFCDMKNKKNLIIIVLLIVNMFATGTVGFFVWRLNSNQSSNERVQYTMYVGTNDKDTYEQIISTEDAKSIIDNICFKYLEGYTIQDAKGSWVDENGLVTHENTIVCYFDDTDNDTYIKLLMR